MALYVLAEEFELPDSVLIVNQWVKVPAKGGKLKDSEGELAEKGNMFTSYMHFDPA